MNPTYQGGQTMPAYTPGQGSWAPASTPTPSAPAPSGTLYYGNTVATPNANVTAAQTQAALGAGWSSTPITASSLAPTTPIPTLPAPITVNNGALVLAGNQGLSNPAYNTKTDAGGLMAVEPMKVDPIADQKKTMADLVKEFAGMRKQAPNSVDMYNNSPEKASFDQYAQEAQGYIGQLNTITAQINAINKNADANKLSLVGQGRGIPEAIIGGQQAQIDREAAINANRLTAEALPLQALLANAQGNKELASQKLDTMFKLRYQDAVAETDFWNKSVDMAYDVFTKAEQRQADLMKEERTAQRNDLQRDVDYGRDLSKLALASGQGTIVQGLSTLIPGVVGTKTYAQDQAKYNSEVARLGGQIVDPNAKLDTQIKQANLANINSEIAKRNSDLKISQQASNPTITNPEAGKYGTALSIILGSDKFTKEQRQAITNSINNGGDPFAVIKNQAKNIMGQTEATVTTKYEVARDTLSAIGSELSQFYAAGGKTSIVSGNFEKVINKLGEVNDPKLVNLATQIQGNLQIYRNAISGTAYSAQEGKDIASIFPGINKSEGLNKAILSGRSTLFDSVIDSSYRTVLGKTYDDLKVVNTTAVNTPSAVVPPVSIVTSADNSIFNSIVTPKAVTVDKVVIPPVTTPEGTFKWPTFNFSSFFK